MKPCLLTLLCLLLFVLVALVVFSRETREWIRARRERERAFKFWTAQCRESLRGMNESCCDAEYEQWHATMRVNMRRYEQEVLGR